MAKAHRPMARPAITATRAPARKPMATPMTALATTQITHMRNMRRPRCSGVSRQTFMAAETGRSPTGSQATTFRKLSPLPGGKIPRYMRNRPCRMH
ncbi:hypothetical protein GCM10019059_33410 [Camelimonas fluminis]|nr:hypothetical protein GCM10019059_33410 [Camelimonas fluminis]